MATIRFKFDPALQPTLTTKERAGLEALTAKEIEKNARDNPDNPPLTEEERARMRSARFVPQVREKVGLSQSVFAKRFHINLARLRDLEQGRTTADSALVAYLQVIARAQKTVERVLASRRITLRTLIVGHDKKSAIERAQKIVARSIGSGRDLVAELIAERRAEAAREEAELMQDRQKAPPSSETRS